MNGRTVPLQLSNEWNHEQLVKYLRTRLPDFFIYIDTLPARADGDAHWYLGGKSRTSISVSSNPTPNGASVHSARGRSGTSWLDKHIFICELTFPHFDCVSQITLALASRDPVPASVIEMWNSKGVKRERAIYVDDSDSSPEAIPIIAASMKPTRKLRKVSQREDNTTDDIPNVLEASGSSRPLPRMKQRSVTTSKLNRSLSDLALDNSDVSGVTRRESTSSTFVDAGELSLIDEEPCLGASSSDHEVYGDDPWRADRSFRYDF